MNNIFNSIKYDINKENGIVYKKIIDNTDIIMGLELYDKDNIYIIQYDYPYFKLIKKNNNFKIYTKSYNSLRESLEFLINNYITFLKFNLIIRDEIDITNNRLIRRLKCPIKFIKWQNTDLPEPDKFFGVSKFKFVRKIPYSLSILCYEKLKYGSWSCFQPNF